MGQRTVRIRRVYDEPGAQDGTRVLVDRVWPRGVRKEDLAMDDWVKDAAPSSDLRKWFAHDPNKFADFRQRYRAELDHDDARASLDRLHGIAGDQTLTLLTATRDVEHSHAAVLAELLRDAS